MLGLRFSLTILKLYKKLSIGNEFNIKYLVIAKVHANNDIVYKNTEKKIY